MKTKKRRLKRWVRVTLIILFIIISSFILASLIDKNLTDYDKMAAGCDEEYGHTCSYYEVRQFSLGK